MPGWQRYASGHQDFVFLSVAADAGGAAAARPWHEAAGATFTTLVDTDNALGRLLDYKIIPNGFFVDEDGVLRGRWIGFSVDNADCIAAVDRFRAGGLAPFERGPRGPAGSPGVAPGPVRTAASLTPLARELYDTRIRFGALLAAMGRDQEAALEWYKALMMDPENFVLRKQVWKLRYPERFAPTIDFEWQKQQLAREREEEESMYRSGCGPDGCVIP